MHHRDNPSNTSTNWKLFYSTPLILITRKQNELWLFESPGDIRAEGRVVVPPVTTRSWCWWTRCSDTFSYIICKDHLTWTLVKHAPSSSTGNDRFKQRTVGVKSDEGTAPARIISRWPKCVISGGKRMQAVTLLSPAESIAPALSAYHLVVVTTPIKERPNNRELPKSTLCEFTYVHNGSLG